MLHIREVSDLHLEHYYDLYDTTVGRAKEELTQLIPPLPTDKKTVLIVSGDLATARRAGRIVTFMKFIVPRFKHVIYVLGNHEHYYGKINESEHIIREALEDGGVNMKKVTIAGNDIEKVEIKGVTFLCCTFWTDYNKGDLETSRVVSRYIVDHRAIQNGDGTPFTTEDARGIHEANLAGLHVELTGKDNSKTVIVTHHMPSYQAVDPQYMYGDVTSRTLNAAFTSDLDEFIIEHKPAYWFFGHTHTKYEGELGRTMLVCNPLGYPNEYNVQRGVFVTDKVYSL
jgi:predicted MPP superfamily phosphohydrolase